MRIFLFIPAIFLFSCKNEGDSAQPNEYAAKFIAQLNPTDTFFYEFPKGKNPGIDSALLDKQLKWEKYLQIQSLKKGFDSIQIRIWYGQAIEGERLITLTNESKTWKAEISNLNRINSVGSDNYDSLTREITYKSPKSGWVKFINQIFNLRILSMPDETKTPGYEPFSPNDGGGISFEIATKKVYRFYGYSNPDYPHYNYKPAEIVLQIIKLLSDEFGISEWPVWPGTARVRRVKPDTIQKVSIQEINNDSVKK